MQDEAPTIEELKEYRAAVDEHAIVSATDLAGTITYVNDKFCDIAGYSREELLGRNHRIVKSGLHPPEVYAEMWNSITSGKTWHGEICNRARDGSLYWVAATIVPCLDENDLPYRYISVRTDITERKNVEERLHEQQRFLSVMTDALGEGVYALDARGLCTFVNPEAERVLGWKAGELKGKLLHDVIHRQKPDGSPLPHTECPLLVATRERRKFHSDAEVFVRSSGEVFPVSLSAMPLLEGDRVAGSVTVFRDISDAKRREAELRDAGIRAEKANRAKSEFLSAMSHELRTPLNAVLGFAQLLEGGRRDPLTERQKEYVHYIMKSGHHLLSLINEVLDLARIEAGRVSMSIENVDLAGVVEEALEIARPLAAKREITITAPEIPEGSMVLADYTRLKQVMINFLSNAVKYNRDRGAIRVRMIPGDDGRIRVEVEDTGPGIPLEKQPELFQPFSRLGAEDTEIEGSGIGLALTRRLMEAMNGKVGFRSKEGEGSVFWAELPPGRARDDQPAVEAIAQIKPAFTAHSGKRLLLVEDNPVNLRLMREIMDEHGGMELIAAHTGELGLELAASHRPDVIVMDINLPGMDGLKTLDRLLRNPDTAHIPVLALSANAMEHDVDRGLKAGFRAYLTKPLVVEELFAAIDAAMEDGAS